MSSDYIGLAAAALGVASFAAVFFFARRGPAPPRAPTSTNNARPGQTNTPAPRTPQTRPRSGAVGGGLQLAEELSLQKHLEWRVVVHSSAVFQNGAVSAIAADIEALQRMTACKGNMFFVHRFMTSTAEDQKAEKEQVIEWAKTHLAPSGWKRECLLFCESEKALEAIPRQLQPTLLVAREKHLCEFMAKFTPFVMCVDKNYTAGSPTQLLTYVSLSSAPV